MNSPRGSFRTFCTAVLWLVAAPQLASSQPLSYWLGAYKLDGLKNLVECESKARGFLETLMADRLEQKLAISNSLTADERQVWLDDIAALRAAVRDRAAYKGPDPSNPNQYLDGLTEDEFRAIHSMNTRFGQEVYLSCQQKYGDIAARTVGEKTAVQAQFEAGLRARMVEPTDVNTLALIALPSPFPEPELTPEEQLAAATEQSRAAMATSQAAVTQIIGCTARMAGLRWEIMADKLQQELDSATDLTAQQRADLAADIRATREAGAQGLAQPVAADPANAYRFMTWLTNEDQAAIGAQYGTQVAGLMANCTQN